MLRTYRYDPSQPRDGDGRWTALSVAGDRVQAGQRAATLATHHEGLGAQVTGTEARARHRATSALATLQKVVNSPDRYSPQEHEDAREAAKAAVTTLRIQHYRARRDGVAGDHEAAHQHYAGQLRALNRAQRQGVGADVVHHFGTPMPAQDGPSPQQQAAGHLRAAPAALANPLYAAGVAAHASRQPGTVPADNLRRALRHINEHAAGLPDGEEKQRTQNAAATVRDALGALRAGEHDHPALAALREHHTASIQATNARSDSMTAPNIRDASSGRSVAAPAPAVPTRAPTPPAADAGAFTGLPSAMRALVSKAASIVDGGHPQAAEQLDTVHRAMIGVRNQTFGAPRDAAVRATDAMLDVIHAHRTGQTDHPALRQLRAAAGSAAAPAPTASAAPLSSRYAPMTRATPPTPTPVPAPVQSAPPPQKPSQNINILEAQPTPATPPVAAPPAISPAQERPLDRLDPTPFPLTARNSLGRPDGHPSTADVHDALSNEYRTKRLSSIGDDEKFADAMESMHDALARAHDAGSELIATGCLNRATRFFHEAQAIRPIPKGEVPTIKRGMQLLEHHLRYPEDRSALNRAERQSEQQVLLKDGPMKERLDKMLADRERKAKAPSVFGYKTETPTGKGWDDDLEGHDLQMARAMMFMLGGGEKAHTEAQRLTGCATYGEFRKRLLGNHPTIDTKESDVVVEPYGDRGLAVQLNLRDHRGRSIGHVKRTIDHSTGVVKHDSFVLVEHRQNEGIGAAMYQSQEEAWKAAGLKTVRIFANIDVGGYAWATHGYDFENEYDRTESRKSVERNIRELHAQGKIDGETLQSHLSLLGHAHHAWEIARFAVTAPGLSEDESRVGKAAMLGSDWHATKDLSDDWPGNAVAADTRERARQRAAGGTE